MPYKIILHKLKGPHLLLLFFVCLCAIIVFQGFGVL